MCRIMAHKLSKNVRLINFPVKKLKGVPNYCFLAYENLWFVQLLWASLPRKGSSLYIS